VEQVLVPVLIMIGATLLVMLAIPLGFLAVSGMYFARRTATWLVPLIRSTAADARRSAVDARRSALALGGRAAHRVVHSRLPQALVTGAIGCALALPAFAAPVRDMEPGWARFPQQGTGSTGTESAAQIGECCSTTAARPVEEQGTNQVRSGPVPVTGGTARQVASVDQCTGSCGQGSRDDKGKSKSHGKSKKKKAKD
jgi:hypothetical protein